MPEAANDTPVVGFYVHHQGRGHATRVQQLLRHLKCRAVVFTSAPAYFDADCPARVVALPLDVPRPDEAAVKDSPAPPALHYAPLGVAGLRERFAILAEWIAGAKPALFFIDLSVEVAMFCRLMGVPTVVTRLQGWRNDLPHLNAFESARAIFCPFPRSLELSPLPRKLRAKAFYTEAYSRFEGRGRAPVQPGLIVVTTGSGGTQQSASRLADLARALPGHTIRVLGSVPQGSTLPSSPNLQLLGHVADPFPHLCAAEVVVCGAGTNTVMEVGSARRPMVCLAEDRAFDEQRNKALGLANVGLAVSPPHWPAAREWPGLLAEASRLDTSRWGDLFIDADLRRAAMFVDRLAHEDRARTVESRGAAAHFDHLRAA